ncbi:MAG TPA: hypothetical protein VIH72_09610 [Candidatus Acidoferrales bacterium]|jgi:hypothetical protein
MKCKTAWGLAIFGIAVAALLVLKEHLDLTHGSVVNWLIPTFKYFNYPGFLVAPWIVMHLPFITHGELSPNMTEANLADGFYVITSGIEWFVVGAILSRLSRKSREC